MKPIEFYGAFEDGLMLIAGHEFVVNGRKFVVHKGRTPFDKVYRVSEPDTGFAVPVIKTKSRETAVASAREVLAQFTESRLVALLAMAAKRRAALSVIP